MKKHTIAKLFIAGLSVCICTTASANGLLGKHYLGASVISKNWGDSQTDSLLGRSTGGSIVGNYNLADNWDFNASYSGLFDSYDTMISTNSFNFDYEYHEVLAGLNYLIPLDAPITPYMGGAIGAVIVKDGSGTESDTAYAAEIGVEWDVCKDAFIGLAATYGYIDNNVSGNDGDYSIRANAGVQVIENLMLVGGLSYSPEEYDSSATIGLVLHQ